MTSTVLFLCTGNYYRSRFAEIYFNWHAAQRGLAWKADSRGLALDRLNPGYMSRHTADWLAAQGIPLGDYQRWPREIAAADLVAAHHIVAVKRTEHRPLVEKRFPDWLDRIEYWEVHDLDCSGPEETLAHLEREVSGLLQRLSGRTVEPIPPPRRSAGS